MENPTPVTRIERWSDKRKSARWTTWWVVLGLLFAVLFGFAATALGAVQVWISYCSWLDDPTVRGCSAKSVLNCRLVQAARTRRKLVDQSEPWDKCRFLHPRPDSPSLYNMPNTRH